jgi:hypothetical protein
MTRALRLVLLLSGLAIASSCARVKPYQRETHARRSMQDRDPVETKLDGHVSEYREGSSGGDGVGGGGCGCN